MVRVVSVEKLVVGVTLRLGEVLHRVRVDAGRCNSCIVGFTRLGSCIVSRVGGWRLPRLYILLTPVL